LDPSGQNQPALLFSQAQQVILPKVFVNRQILCYSFLDAFPFQQTLDCAT